MSNVTERVIARVERAIGVGAPIEAIIDFLAHEGITGYDAFLAYKAAEVSIRMAERVYVEHK